MDLSKRAPRDADESIRRDIRVWLLLRETLDAVKRVRKDDDLMRSLDAVFTKRGERFKEKEPIDLSACAGRHFYAHAAWKSATQQQGLTI